MAKGIGHEEGRHGKGRLWKRGNRWWVQYYVHGQQVRESSGSDKKAVAEKLLMRRLVEADYDTAPSKQRPVTYEEMRERLVTARLKSNFHLSPQLATVGLKHLDAAFAGMRATLIDDDRINEFIVARQKAGASNATINRALAALRQIFRLSLKIIKEPPDFKSLLLKEPPARKGFLERAEYLRLLAALPTYVRPIFTFAYFTGMRLGELKNLTWRNVDLREGMIRLAGEQTKNAEPREIPYRQVPELKELIDDLQNHKTNDPGLVFTRAKGRPLGSFRKAWIRACIKTSQGRMLWECPTCHSKIEVEKQPWPPERPKTAPPQCACGVPCRWKYAGRIFHDLRRTAIRNLSRAGVPELVAMRISGHKTREVYERYRIINTDDIVRAMEKLEQFQRAEDRELDQLVARLN